MIDAPWDVGAIDGKHGVCDFKYVLILFSALWTGLCGF